MVRCIFSTFLLAIVFLGLKMVLPHPGYAEGPSLVLSENTAGPAIIVTMQEDGKPALAAENVQGRGVESGPSLREAEDPEKEPSKARSIIRSILRPVVRPADQPPPQPVAPMRGVDIRQEEEDAPEQAESPSISPAESLEVLDKPAPTPADQVIVSRELKELRETVDRLVEESRVREQLRITDDEERDEEEEILTAAGREYTLMPAGMIGFELNVNYSYFSYDSIRQMAEKQGMQLEYRANHNIHNNLVIESARRDNLTLDASIPFVYKYDQVSTSRSRDITNLGDISLGIRYQPFRTGSYSLSPIVNTRVSLPTGRGDYDIDPARELSTGSGLYSVSAGVSASHPFDPVNAFGTINYRYRFNRSGIGQRRGGRILDKVEPGDRISVSLGFGYAVSYRMSMSISYSYTYGLTTYYHFRENDKTSTGDMVSSSFNISTAWRATPRRTIITGVGIGLTNDDPDFNFSLRLPFQFDLR